MLQECAANFVFRYAKLLCEEEAYRAHGKTAPTGTPKKKAKGS